MHIERGSEQTMEPEVVVEGLRMDKIELDKIEVACNEKEPEGGNSLAEGKGRGLTRSEGGRGQLPSSAHSSKWL